MNVNVTFAGLTASLALGASLPVGAASFEYEVERARQNPDIVCKDARIMPAARGHGAIWECRKKDWSLNLFIGEQLDSPGTMKRGQLHVSRPPSGDIPQYRADFASAVIRHFGADRQDELLRALASCAVKTIQAARFDFEFTCVHGGAVTTQKMFVVPRY